MHINIIYKDTFTSTGVYKGIKLPLLYVTPAEKGEATENCTKN